MNLPIEMLQLRPHSVGSQGPDRFGVSGLEAQKCGSDANNSRSLEGMARPICCNMGRHTCTIQPR